jgi:hypothetical protein
VTSRLRWSASGCNSSIRPAPDQLCSRNAPKSSVESCAQGCVLLHQRAVVVCLHRIPRVEVAHLADAGLEHLLQASEARLGGGGHGRAEGLLSEPGGGEQCVLLSVHADADVICATTKSVVVATRASVAAAV